MRHKYIKKINVPQAQTDKTKKNKIKNSKSTNELNFQPVSFIQTLEV